MEQSAAFNLTSQVLPDDAKTRRLAMSILTHRAIAQRREHEVIEVLGDDASYLGLDLVAATTSEVAGQLLLTEHLIEQGWAFADILRSVWYREDALRGVVLP